MSAGSAVLVRFPHHECVGPHDAPVVVVLGGISASAHVCASDADPRPGWWDNTVGPGRAIDTTQYRVLGLDWLERGVASADRITTHDQADALAAVLDGLGAVRIDAIVGASYGGMVALAFASRYPDRVERMVVISAAHRTDAMTAARRSIQRDILRLGVRTGSDRDAVRIARALAMTTYRSRAEFAARFHSLEAIESYLHRVGERFAGEVSAARFLALSLSADLHAVEPESIAVPVTIVAAENDEVVPRGQLEELSERLAGPATLVDLPSIHGHDAFLTEPGALSEILTTALSNAHR